MTKVISAILIAAMMITTPAKAEPAKPQCQQGDMITIGVGLFIASYLGIKFLAWFGEGMKEVGAKEEREKHKANCKL